MKIAIVGYGKMGKMIEQAAIGRGHEIIAKFDIDNNVNGEGLTAETLVGVDVAIDFSIPDAVISNIAKLQTLGIPTVVGATGWYDKIDEVKKIVEANHGSLVWASNFSVGMNLFFKTIKFASELFARFAEYDPFIVEQHHKFKLDAPSGTALGIGRLGGG